MKLSGIIACGKAFSGGMLPFLQQARRSNIRASPGHCDKGRTINLEIDQVDAARIDAGASHAHAVRLQERKSIMGNRCLIVPLLSIGIEIYCGCTGSGAIFDQFKGRANLC